jgi:hypothetical protein
MNIYCLIRPCWGCLFPKLPHRGNVGRQDDKVLRTGDTNAFTVKIDFEGDHSFVEQMNSAAAGH